MIFSKVEVRGEQRIFTLQEKRLANISLRISAQAQWKLVTPSTSTAISPFKISLNN